MSRKKKVVSTTQSNFDKNVSKLADGDVVRKKRNTSPIKKTPTEKKVDEGAWRNLGDIEKYNLYKAKSKFYRDGNKNWHALAILSRAVFDLEVRTKTYIDLMSEKDKQKVKDLLSKDLDLIKESINNI